MNNVETTCVKCESEFQIKILHTFEQGVCFCPVCGAELDLPEED